MASDTYKFQERFQDVEYWRERLIHLWPWEIEDFFIQANENEYPIIGEISFWCAMHFCYLEHGYFNRYLTDEGHQSALQSAEQIAHGIRKIWRFNKDILERFEEAYKFSIERGTKYGWTTTTFDILAGEPDEFNEMMKARIEQEKIKKAIELNKANER